MKIVILLSFFTLTLGNLINDRIYGGESTTIEEHPYQASLQYNHDHFCGGSIVNKDTIVTAAHCFQKRNPDYITVKVGSTYLNFGQEYKIAKIFQHPEYSKGANANNDIAVIKLDKPLTFSNKVQPIELQPPDSPVPVGTTALATGWGGYGFFILGFLIRAFRLQVVDLVVISNERCQPFYNNTEFTITSSMLCTHSPGKGTYHGDSGGPLVVNNKLIGVTSFGNASRYDFPDVFTDVSVFNGFIKKYC